MHPLSRIRTLAFVLPLFCGSQAEAANSEAKAVTIPLDKIWTNGKPGTRNIDQLEEENLKVTGELLWRPIAEALITTGADSIRKKEPARPGFAVEGTGVTALGAAHAVLVDGEKPRASFSKGTEISLVFFSYPSTSDVQLRRIQRDRNVIEVRYRFVGRMERNLAFCFALIPLGELPAGKYQLKLVQAPLAGYFSGKYEEIEPPRKVKSASRFVSGPFWFELVDKGK